jgi:hypothetical protein
MEKAMTETVAASFDKHFAEYQELARAQMQLQERIHKVEAEKDNVKENIYQKVHGDYQKELTALEERLKPIKAEVDKARDAITTKMGEIDEEARAMQDRIDELALRYRVGEFDRAALAEHEQPLKKAIDELGQRRAELAARLASIDNAGRPSEKPSATPEATPAPPAAPAAEPAKKETPAAKPTPLADQTGFIDLKNWMNEFGDGAKRRTDQSDAEPHTATATSDPVDMLSNLADSSDDSATAAESNTNADMNSSGTFPVLIVTRGPGSGKKIPLVPMTMTLGREHDNNIELKDEDVARYHARISFQRGRYLLQDLESSSGTWVNDLRITETTLKHGDKIRVGNTELIIDFES